MTSAWHIDTIRTTDDFLALSREWEELRSRQAQAQPFISHAWLVTWWRSYGTGELAVVTVRHGGRLVAAAPCYLRRQAVRKVPGFVALRLLGDAGVGSTYLDVMVDPAVKQDALKALAGGMARLSSDFWQFRPLHDDALLAELCVMHAKAVVRLPGETSPTVDCAQPWEAYLATLSANKRKDIRRKMRDLEKLGPYVMREYCLDDRAGLAEATSLLERFNKARFELIGINGGFCDDKLAAFHRELIPTLAATGDARLYVLWSGETPIAALYLICDKGHWCAYQSGFDPAWTEYGPGTLLDDLVMMRVMESGEASIFDFCQGTQEYKMRYSSKLIPTETLEVYGRNFKGRIAAGLAATRGAPVMAVGKG